MFLTVKLPNSGNFLTKTETVDTDSISYYNNCGYNGAGNMTDPSGYSESCTYDLNNNVLAKKDKNGNKLSVGVSFYTQQIGVINSYSVTVEFNVTR